MSYVGKVDGTFFFDEMRNWCRGAGMMVYFIYDLEEDEDTLALHKISTYSKMSRISSINLIWTNDSLKLRLIPTKET